MNVALFGAAALLIGADRAQGPHLSIGGEEATFGSLDGALGGSVALFVTWVGAVQCAAFAASGPGSVAQHHIDRWHTTTGYAVLPLAASLGAWMLVAAGGTLAMAGVLQASAIVVASETSGVAEFTADASLLWTWLTAALFWWALAMASASLWRDSIRSSTTILTAVLCSVLVSGFASEPTWLPTVWLADIGGVDGDPATIFALWSRGATIVSSNEVTIGRETSILLLLAVSAAAAIFAAIRERLVNPWRD